MANESGRIRAWVLVHSEDTEATAKALSDYFEDGGDDFVVVRADVVDGDLDLIVPVDAANEDILKEVAERIRAANGVTEISVSTVRMHYPNPPHSASTFITAEELELYYLREFDPPGRHPQSPGANAWG